MESGTRFPVNCGEAGPRELGQAAFLMRMGRVLSLSIQAILFRPLP